jgi:6-pyruvoyltetrahydropterin/6-carboxytetrahydropterin synthase
VRVRSRQPIEGYLKGQGILIDFKELKMLVNENVVRVFDHKLVLSKEYLSNTKNVFSPEALFVFDAEPTAENMLIYIRNTLLPIMPSHIKLSSLQLWETRDSYAEWYAI